MGNNRPFDLAAAMANNIVCTRDGRKVRILAFDRKNDDYPIVALVENGLGREDACAYKIDGTYYSSGNESPLDLMMPPEKQEGWLNLYKSGDTIRPGGTIFNTKDAAMIAASADEDKYLKTIKINWED